MMVLAGCPLFKKKKDSQGNTDQDGIVGNQSSLLQYTPDKADWSGQYSGETHDPYAGESPFISDWGEAENWDGQHFDTSIPSLLPDQVCPQVTRNNGAKIRLIRGIGKLYQEVKPFRDPKNPSKAEVDHWHGKVLNHLRTLVTPPDQEVFEAKPSHCLFATANWGDQFLFRGGIERLDSSLYTIHKYEVFEGESGKEYVPVKIDNTSCWGKNNDGKDRVTKAHCGYNYRPPTSIVQQEYVAAEEMPEKIYSHPGCDKNKVPDECGRMCGIASSEGVFGFDASVPWSLRLAAIFCGTFASGQYNGKIGGHTGPYFGRQGFGFSFWNETNRVTANRLRANWGGKRLSCRLQGNFSLSCSMPLARFHNENRYESDPSQYQPMIWNAALEEEAKAVIADCGDPPDSNNTSQLRYAKANVSWDGGSNTLDFDSIKNSLMQNQNELSAFDRIGCAIKCCSEEEICGQKSIKETFLAAAACKYASSNN